MSLALSKAKTNYCPYLYWRRFSDEAEKKSRYYAISCMMSVLVFFTVLFFIPREQTMALQTVKQKTVLIMRNYPVSTPVVKKEKMQKILTENSDFEIPKEIEQIKEIPKTEKILEPTKQKTKEKFVPKPAAPQRKKAEPNDDKQQHIQSIAPTAVPQAVGNAPAENMNDNQILTALLQKIEKHKVYPRNLRRNGTEGKCRLQVNINAQGKVTAIQLIEKSGKRVLDVACEQLGEKLIGFDVGVKKAVSVVVPVHYRLSDK